MNITLVKSSFGDKIQNFELTFENPYQDVDSYLRHVKQRLIELLNQEQRSHNGIKVKLSLKCIFLEKCSHGVKIQKNEKLFPTNLKTYNNEGDVDGMFKEIKDQIRTNENTKLQKIVHLLIYVDSTKEVPLVVFVKFQEEEVTSDRKEYVPAGFGCYLLQDNEGTYFYHQFECEKVFCDFWEILETKVNEKLGEKKPNFVPILIVDFEKYSHCFLIQGLKRNDEVTILGSVNKTVILLNKKTIHTTLKCLDFSKFLPTDDSGYDSNKHEDIHINVMDMVGMFMKIRKLCDGSGLDLTNYLSLAQFAWDHMLKFRSINGEEPIPVLEDEEKIEFIAKSIRGGLLDSPKRKAKANNRYMKNYNDHEQQTFIVSLDLNNAYGWAMSQNLPWDNFCWVDDIEEQFPDEAYGPIWARDCTGLSGGFRGKERGF